jgi:hypothetical protein
VGNPNDRFGPEDKTMSQRNVEQVIGRLVTDEGFRRRFARDRRKAIEEILATGCELNPCERQALAGIDLQEVDRLAGAIDPSIQKIETRGGRR